MSKEEICKKNKMDLGFKGPDESDKILLSMDQYAEQESISFAEWISDSHYSRTTNGLWRITRSISEVEKSTAELYQLFLQSKTKS